MLGFGKKKIYSSEIAIGLLENTKDQIVDYYCAFVEALESIAKLSGRGSYVSQQMSGVHMPEMIYWSYQIALGMVPAKNLFPNDVYLNIFKVAGIEATQLATADTKWFPAHFLETHKLIATGKHDPVTLAVSGLLEDYQIIVDESSARDFGGPLSMMGLVQVLASHQSVGYIKSISQSYKVRL